MADLKQYTANKSFCSMAWMHQFMDPTGRVKPCCRFEERARPNENNLNEQSLKDIFTGQWMSEIRKKMLAGDSVDGCTRCYQEEAAGKKSLRQRYNQSTVLPIDKLISVENPEIRWVELAISNACNLACRMCDSRYSLKWFDEEKEIFGSTASKNKLAKINIDEINPYLESIVHLKFTGGEPLITKEQWQVLDRLLAAKDCSDVYLNYSTNCTIYPKDEWVEKWNKFKFIEFALSYDSANKKEAEYIRWPAKYSEIDKTTRAFVELDKSEKFFCVLRTTVSSLNVWSLPETIEWWEEKTDGKNKSINPTHLTFPAILSVTVLPLHIKQKISEKYDQYLEGDYSKELKKSLSYIKNYMNSRDDSHLLMDLKSYINKTDQYRNQNFFESYPHFSDIFDS